MTFSTPTALFWLLLAVPIIALYVLRVRLRRVPVSTGMFWKQVYKENQTHSLWNRLRHLTSLLVQLLLLLLLAVAVADPWFPSQRHKSSKFVVVIDSSASMQATDISPTRFEAGRRYTHEMIDSLGTENEMAIVVAGPTPRVAITMSSRQRALHQAVDAIEPVDAPADIRAATELAQHMPGGNSRSTILVLTDARPEPTPDTAPAEGVSNVEYRVFASDAANIGITRFRTRRSLVDPLGYEVLIQVRNASPRPLQCRVELDLNDIPVDVLSLNLAPEESWERSVEKTAQEGGVLMARLLIEDQSTGGGEEQTSSISNRLRVDDIAYAVLPERRMQKVLLVTPGNVFLEKVIEANPLVALKTVRRPPDKWPSDAIMVLHQQTIPHVPDGNVIVVDPKGNSDLWQVGEALRDPIVTTQDATSPLMKYVRLDNIVIPKASRFTFDGPAELLATSATDDPIYAQLQRDNGDCLLLNANLDESDLAFRTVFPILFNNALSWFAGGEQGELSSACITGEVVTVPVPGQDNGHQQQYCLIHPDGSRSDLALSRAVEGADSNSTQQSISVGPLMDVGIYYVEPTQIDDDSNDALLPTVIPASLLNAAESDLRPRSNQHQTSPLSAYSEGSHSRPLWFYLAAFAGILSLTEWALFNRRYTD